MQLVGQLKGFLGCFPICQKSQENFPSLSHPHIHWNCHWTHLGHRVPIKNHSHTLAPRVSLATPSHCQSCEYWDPLDHCLCGEHRGGKSCCIDWGAAKPLHVHSSETHSVSWPKIACWALLRDKHQPELTVGGTCTAQSDSAAETPRGSSQYVAFARVKMVMALQKS